jgi:PKD repeat protein
MPVRLSGRLSEISLQTGSSTQPLGNVGDWITSQFSVECGVWHKTSEQGQVILNTDRTITCTGTTWAELGFEVGDTISGTIDITELPSTNRTYTATSVVITAIVGNLLTYSGGFERSGSHDLMTDHPQLVTIPSVNGTHAFNFVDLYVNKAFTGLELKFNQIPNTTVGSPSFASVLDGVESVWRGGGLDCTDTTVVALSVTNPRSGMAIHSVTCAGDGGAIANGINTFDVYITHNIIGIYDDVADLAADIQSSWLLGSLTMGDVVSTKWYKTFNDESCTVSGVRAQSGNIGWFNENFNGGVNNYTLSNIIYKNATDTVISSIQSSGLTKIQFDVTGAGFSTENSKFVWGIVTAPADRSAYAANNVNALANLCGNTMGVGSTYSHAPSLTSGTIAGFPNAAGAQLDVSAYWFNVQSSTALRVIIHVTPNTAFTNYINSLASGDKLFAWWVSVGTVGDFTATDRVNLMQTGQYLEAPIVVEPLKTVSFDQFYPREKDYYTTPGSSDDTTIITEDDTHFALRMTMADDSVMSTVRYGIETYDNTTNDAISELDSFTCNLLGSPIDINGTQQINFTAQRNVPYVSGFKHRQVTIRRYSALDSGVNRGYEFVLPFRARWEWWLANNSLSTAYYSSGQPLNNLNNEWFTKQAGVSELRLFIETTIDGTLFRNVYNFDLLNYRNSNRYLKDTEIWNNGTFTSQINLGSKTNKYAADEFVILDGQTNYIRAIFTAPSTINAQTYAELTIEVEDGAGFTSQWKIRTDQTAAANNPLSSLTSTLDTSGLNPNDVWILTCAIDPSKITGTNFKVTSEWVGATSESYGDPPSALFHERDICWGVIDRLPTPEPDETCTIDECNYELPVIADTTDDSREKNDVLGIFEMFTNVIDTIEFFLVEEDGTEHALDDNTYGTYIDAGTYTYEPNFKGYQLRWRDVLTALGEGCYKIKTVITDKRSTALTKYSCCYRLTPYSCDNVRGTVRITSVQNGNFTNLGINFKGMDWTSDIRFNGRFGEEKPIHNSTNYVRTDNVKELNRIDLKSEFVLRSKLIPHICVTHPLKTYHLMASGIFITDYNPDNHRQDYKLFPVYFEEIEDMSYFVGNTNATMTIKFSERAMPNRVTTCDGVRPLPAIDGEWVWNDQCEGVDIDVNGVSYGTAASGTTFDVDVVDQDGVDVGSLVGGEWVVPYMEVDFNASPTYLSEGEDVTFTDTSTLSPTEWAWSFGDGNWSNSQNPVHTYNTAGIFDVRLLAAKVKGGGFIEKIALIEVIPSFATIFSANYLFDWNPDVSASVTTSGGGALDSISSVGLNTAAFTQTGAARPQLVANQINGKPVIRFDGATSFMAIASSTALFNFLHNSTGGTVIIVSRVDALGVANAFIGNTVGASEVGSRFLKNISNKYSAFLTNGTSIVVLDVTTNDYANNQYNSTINIVDPANATANQRSLITLNGSNSNNNTDTATPTSANATRNMEMGRRQTSPFQYLNGDIARIIIVDAKATPTQQAQVAARLAYEYGTFPI